MKFFKISIILLIAGYLTSNAEVDPLQKRINHNGNKVVNDYTIIKSKNKSDKLASISFTVFDSLANSLSYMSNLTQPFIYEPETGTLITVKRGSHETTKPDFNRNNSKNNLFLRTSKDWGKSWAPSIMLYDKGEWNYGEVRYPSVAAYKDPKNNVMLGYTFALIDEAAGDWKGFATGFYGDLDADGFITSASLPSGTITINDSEVKGDFAWGTDSKIVAFDNQGVNIIATGDLTLVPDTSLTKKGSIGFRTTKKLESVDNFMPQQWNYLKFGKVDTISRRPNEQIGLQRTKDGKIYFGAMGDFITKGSDDKYNECGVSISNDNGKTWSEFELFPTSKVKEYINSIQGNPTPLDTKYFNLSFIGNDFIAFDNGDWSFIDVLTEVRDTINNIKSTNDLVYHIVELYKEGGNFGIRKISDVPQGWVGLTSDKGARGSGPRDYELQVSKTVDGTKIVVKWLKVNDYSFDDATNTYVFSGADIYAAARMIGTNKWGNPKNLTNDNAIYKGTWIPNLLPNDLKEIPLILCQTKGDLSDNANQRLYISEQYLSIGMFDGSELTGIEDEQAINEQNVSIYPNPATNLSTLRFYTANNENVEVRIVDIYGKEISTSTVNSLVGFNNFEIDAKNLTAGAYFVSIKGKSITKFEKFNVVK